MENYTLGYNAVGIVDSEIIPKMKSSIWQSDCQSVHRAELICPRPRRAMRVPFVMDGVGRLSPKTKSVLAVPSKEYVSDILNMILNKDEYNECDSDACKEVGILYGSPPVRTDNPLVNDTEFVRQIHAAPSPPDSHFHMKPSARVGSSASRVSSEDVKPKVRIVGFARKNQESHGVRHALALAPRTSLI